MREVLPLETILMQYLRHNWRNGGGVEDLRQEIYMRVYEAASKQRPERTKAFVFTTARNLLITRGRRAEVVPIEAVGDLDILGVASDEPGAGPQTHRARRTAPRAQRGGAIAAALSRSGSAAARGRSVAPRNRPTAGPRRSNGRGISRQGDDGAGQKSLSRFRGYLRRAWARSILRWKCTREEADARAAAWLERCEGNDWSPTDQAELDAWLAQSIAHRVAYWRLKAAWGRTERLSVLRGASSPERGAGKGLRTLLGRSAAVVCIAAIAGAVSYFYPRTDEWTYSTPLGGHETVHLADGSQIELNTDTVIRVADNGSGRKVWLDRGEAFFQVRHDADHPFTVMARPTASQISARNLLCGRMAAAFRFRWSKAASGLNPPVARMQTHPTILVPGDVIVATRGCGFAIEKIGSGARCGAGLAAWMFWCFDHTTLADAADEFNRYNKR